MPSVYDAAMADAYLRGRNLRSADVTARLAELGVSQTARIEVPQRYAGSARELIDKVTTRSLSNLAALPHDVFAAGLQALHRDAPGLTYPLDEQLDLIVCTG